VVCVHTSMSRARMRRTISSTRSHCRLPTCAARLSPVRFSHSPNIWPPPKVPRAEQ